MELNVEQKKIVESKPNGHMLIRGVAGSGKTTVAIHKIPHLLNHYCLEQEEVLVLTYAKTLINYIDYIYNQIEHEDTLFPLLNNNKNVKIFTIDKLIYQLYRQYERELNSKQLVIIDTQTQYKIMDQAIPYISEKYPEQKIVNMNNRKFLLDEIEWIKSNKYDEIEIYQSVDRIGRNRNFEEDSPQKISKNSINRKAIFETMVTYDNLMVKDGYIDFRTMALRVLSSIEKGEISLQKHNHIIVDESQDLSRVQLMIIANMYRDSEENSSIIFIADTAQSIYLHSWLSHQTFKSIGFDMHGRARVLSKNYRTTTEIAEAAYSLIEDDLDITNNEIYVKPSVIDRRGQYPVYRQFNSDKEELDFICSEINNNLYKKYDLKDIVIVARTMAQLDNAKNYLIKNKIDCKILNNQEIDFDDEKVKLITMHSVKGLEFKVVMIIGLNKNVIPYTFNNSQEIEDESMERRLLYVGMTRAKEELYLTSSGKPSKFIVDINPKFLRQGDITGFSRLNHIGIEFYRFKDKIIDLYSNEEVVRQWVIDEVINKLGYPLEFVEIEYKVQVFSATGYVDIVIFRNFNGKKMPYIFIETKKHNTGLGDAELSQLISYMGTSESVVYGMLTNGSVFKIVQKLNQGYENISNLPSYVDNSNDLIEKFSYIDIRKNKRYNLHRNYEDKELIHLFEEHSDIVQDIKEYHKLNVYGEIVAGNLNEVYQDLQGDFQFPEQVLTDPANCFMLKVDGDSMINAGIKNGDYVVIHKQSYAENLDIVVAIVGQEATLKKYTRMGNTILLMPENKSFEPIMVNEEELIINGKVIGILKSGD